MNDEKDGDHLGLPMLSVIALGVAAPRSRVAYSKPARLQVKRPGGDIAEAWHMRTF